MQTIGPTWCPMRKQEYIVKWSIDVMMIINKLEISSAMM
jgi:hypothetical protein